MISRDFDITTSTLPKLQAPPEVIDISMEEYEEGGQPKRKKVKPSTPTSIRPTKESQQMSNENEILTSGTKTDDKDMADDKQMVSLNLMNIQVTMHVPSFPLLTVN